MTPSRRLLLIFFALVALGFLQLVLPQIATYVWAPLGLLALCTLADARELRRTPDLSITRTLQGVWPVDVWNSVTLTIHNHSQYKVRLDLIDDYPTAWQLEGLPHTTSVAANGFTAITYRLRPNSRGNAQFGQPFVRVRAFFQLWERQFRIGETHAVKVFPDFSNLLGNSLHATDRRSPTVGAIRKRRRGEGTDFRQLRDYRQGDSQRSIDWKATARYQKPISREYQEERDQQIIFLLDTGRRMLAQDGVTNHFDHALNAILTLSFIAQKQGDAIGLMTFGGDSRWLAPYKGRVGLDRMLAGVYDLQASEVAPDYTLAASALLNKLNKRAFVVLITNLRDEDDQAMRTACELLSTKHLVLCASLREKSLDTALSTPVRQFPDALRYAASTHYLQQREQAIKRLGIRASQLIDILPERLSFSLVNRYLEIKESGAL
jgi:uncharacterized protein (DUF58 family)